MKDFRLLCEQKDINANIDFNKRRTKNEHDSEYMIDNELYKEWFSVEQFNA